MKQQQSRFIRMGMPFMKRMDLRLFSRYIRVGDYCYGFPPYVCTVSARLFEKEAWYIRLILEGEDRLFRNLENKGTESYRILPFCCGGLAGIG